MKNFDPDNSANQESIIDFTEESRKKVSAEECGRSLEKYIREFCELSSIQGLAYIAKSISLLERIWWIIIFTAAVSGSYLMVNNLIDKWITTPVMVSLATKESIISDIPFPAVTICPETKISRKCLNYTKILRERMKGDVTSSDLTENLIFDLMAIFCKNENHRGTFSFIRGSLGESSEELHAFEESSSQNEVSIDDYSEFLADCAAVTLDSATCMWMGEKVKCTEVMTPVMTDEGLCYTFNMYDVRDIYSDLNSMQYLAEGKRRRDWDPDDGYTKHSIDLEDMYPRRAFQIGAKNSFTAVFVTEKADLNYACQEFATQGLRVSLHNPARLARPGQVFFSVGLDEVAVAAVIPTFTYTSKGIQSYDPDKRCCFFGHERKLKYFNYYSQSNCNLECWTNYTQQRCGCVNYYMPRDNETTICNLERRYCLQDARRSYTQDILKERLKSPTTEKNYGTSGKCHCLPLCSDLNYNVEVASTEWDLTNPDEVGFDEFRESVSLIHASAVRVFFKDHYFLPTRRGELYGTTDLISNIGGTLGLFMGFSLMSLGEIIYFLSVRLIENYRKYRYWAGPRHLNED